MIQSKYIHGIEVASTVDQLAELLHLENRTPVIQAAVLHHSDQDLSKISDLHPETIDILQGYDAYRNGSPITQRTPLGVSLLILAHYLYGKITG